MECGLLVPSKTQGIPLKFVVFCTGVHGAATLFLSAGQWNVVFLCQARLKEFHWKFVAFCTKMHGVALLSVGAGQWNAIPCA